MKKEIYLFILFFFGGLYYTFSQPGAIDLTFNPTDIGFGEHGANNTVRIAALQPDGKIIIGGDFTDYKGTARNRIARLNEDGTIDTSFNPGTGVNAIGGGNVQAIAIQSDGKFIIGGSFSSFNGTSRNGIARLNANGSLDSTFNPGTGVSNFVQAISIQSDGKIIIGGFFSSFNGTTINQIARLDTNGTLDTVFNPGTGANSAVRTISLQPDGKIIIGGDFTTFNSITNINRIARLNMNGSLDTTFHPGNGASSTVSTISLQPDGKIVIGGAFTTFNSISRNGIAQLNGDGTLDTTFNSGGANGSVNSISLQSDGKLIIGGSFNFFNGVARGNIVRLNIDRSYDVSFNPGTGAAGGISSTLLQPDGKIIIVGSFTRFNNADRLRIARLNEDGTLNSPFNRGTGANNPITGAILASAIQTDQKIIIGGSFTTYNDIGRNRIARLNADGNLDTTFNPGTGANHIIRTISVQTDGKIIIGGNFTTYNGTPIIRVARLNPDGTLDVSFNPGNGPNLAVNSLSVQPDGKIIIGGDFTSYNGPPGNINKIARLNANGTLDTTFNPGTGPSSTILTTSLQSDGKIIIGGNFNSFNGISGRNGIARINANGTIDSTFNPGSAVNLINVYSILLQPDGKLIIGGSFSGTSRNRIVRLNTNGSLDASFNIGTGANNTVFTTLLQSDGKLIIGGDFTSYYGIGRNRIARVLNGCNFISGGYDQFVCDSFATLASTIPLSGTGSWTVVSGSGTFANVGQHNTIVSNLGVGPNTFKWTISDSVCGGFDEVSISYIQDLFIDFSGLEENYCFNNVSSVLTGIPAGGTFFGTGISGNVFSPSTIGQTVITYIPPVFSGCPSNPVIKTTTVYSLPNVTINSSDGNVLCPDSSTILTATSTASSYLWNNGSIANNINVSTGDVYLITVTDSNNCSSTDTFNISIDTIPQITTNGASTICDGDSVILTYNLNNLVWSTGAATPSITVIPTSTTTYYALGTSSNGCYYNDSMIITVNPMLPPDPVSNMQPIDSAIDVLLPVTLSWLPGSFSTKYDLYIWPDSLPQPATPFKSNLSGVSHSIIEDVYNGLTLGISYYWKIVSKNGSCFSTDGPVQRFVVKKLPDLKVQNIQFPPTAVGGQNISITWDVLNLGNGHTSTQQWNDAIFLSVDTILDYLVEVSNSGGDLYISHVPNFSALLPGQSYSNSISYTLPLNAAGTYYVFVITNTFYQLKESGLAYNTRWTAPSNNIGRSITPITVSLPPLPDLRVASIVNQNNAFSGDTINVTYSVRNFGNGSTGLQTWADKIFITDQPFLDTNITKASAESFFTGNLLPDSTYTKTLSVRMPAHVFGPFFIYVLADFSNKVYENIFENNNQNSNTIQIFLTPPPDLTVTNFVAPLSASSGQTVSVSWTVVNQGITATDSFWIDKVFISSDSSYNLLNAILLESKSLTTVLDPGESYSKTLNVVIPLNISGPQYLFVKADGNNQLFEYNMEGNNTQRSDSVTVLNSDLLVTYVTSPPSAEAGDQVTLHWKILNSGYGSVFNQLRKDFVFLSPTNVFQLNTAILIDSFSYTESVPAISIINKQKTVTLPNHLNGIYYVFVFADFKNHVFEVNENNNVNSASPNIQINLTSWADFTASAINISDTVSTIEPLGISYSIINSGTRAANGSWVDSLFISKKSTWDTDSALFIKSFPQTRFLNSSSSYSSNSQIILPLTKDIPNGSDSAQYFFYLVTDAGNEIFENTGEANNVFRSAPVFVFNHFVDHVITTVTGQDTITSGMPSHVKWTVKNIGGITNQSYYFSWIDIPYLSSDTILDALDIELGQFPLNNPLNTNNTYTLQKTFNVPNGISGNYYVIASSALRFQKIKGEINHTNNSNLIRDVNGDPKAVFVNSTPPPDLKVTFVEAPAQGQAGQPMDVKFTIINDGLGVTNPNQWQNGIYLSGDFVFSGDDIFLASKPFISGLNPGESKSDSVQLSLPIQANGNYVIIVKTDMTNAIYETNNNNNLGFSTISITQPAPSDLVSSNIGAPGSVIAGQSVTISWQLKNKGINLAAGLTKEGVYFSKDSLWDISDPLLGIVSNTINVAPGDFVNHSITADLTSAPIGDHYVLVRADLLNNIIEQNENNNVSASQNKVVVAVNNLPLNVLTPDSLFNNTFLYYSLYVEDSLSGETLLVTLKGDSINGYNEIYASHEEVPTRSSFDFSFSNPASGNQELLIPSISNGTYYFAIYGNTNASSQPVTLFAEILPFAIRSVNSNKGGNTGNVTVKITGSNFSPQMKAHLLSNSNPYIEASKVTFVNSTTLFATFNLNRKPLGLYDVGLIKTDSSTAILNYGFEIEAGSSGSFYVGGVSNSGMSGDPNAPGCDPGAEAGINQSLQISVNSPSRVNVGRIVTMQISFGNAGNVDIPIPTRMLVCNKNLPVALIRDELALKKKELYLEFRESGGPADILRAGATGTITVFVNVTIPRTETVTFSLK